MSRNATAQPRLLYRLSLMGLCAAMGCANAETVLSVDASSPAAAPLENTLKLGTAVSRTGHRIGANSRYLTRDGRPWLPVMGEYHYSRAPAAQWEAELRKMKAAGVDVVASYIIWNHHENEEGHFDWQGNRDLRRFILLAQRAGLDVVLRIGPWAHAEVRFGGIPDWVVNLMPTRRNDPQYLHYVARLYGEIGRQARGLMFKDGGPVIGVQLENEYNLAGEGEGAEHIAKLKELARAAGMDVPLYTVTGWDRTVYPSGEVTPVFGGYPDEPWAASRKELAPKETYAFRFDTRVSGDLGAQTRSTRRGTAETDMGTTPFLGAEYGGGLPFMYRRRPVVSPDDIASMVPVQLGSGVNLLGYYMFHGGRNPLASPSMEESAPTGGYNDTPAINYDFQAPLGPDGQQRPVLTYLRPYHLFLRDFGERLAPMVVRKPEMAPANPADLATPRFSVRSDGDSAFLFVNNHVRQYSMADQAQVRFSIALPGQTVTLPSQPVDVHNGAYFIWPVNFDLDGVRLTYATAQPLARLDEGRDGVTYVFAATPGMPVEFAFPASGPARIDGAAVASGDPALRLVRVERPGMDAVVNIEHGGKRVRLLVLTPEQARTLSVGVIAGKRSLVLSDAQVWFDEGALQLRSKGDPAFSFAVYPALDKAPGGAAWRVRKDGRFQRFDANVAPVRAEAVATLLRPAGNVAAVPVGGRANTAMRPYPEQFRTAAAWTVQATAPAAPQVEQYLLQPDMVGDVARLFDGTRMVDDWFYSGYGWEYPVAAGATHALTLQVLPLRADAPIYIPKEAWPDFGGKQQAGALRGVKLAPVYRAEARFGKPR
jgi:hypothetical protein